MAFHHVAIATRDIQATHRFYTEVMGFTLARVEAAPTPEGGWARHVFYDTGSHGEMIAFWDLHDTAYDEFNPSISKGLGLPVWTNHIAFDAPTLEDLEVAKRRWQDAGERLLEIDHGWCTSIYTVDPNGIMVEFCTSTAELTDADRAKALELLMAEKPPLATPPEGIVHEPTRTSA